MAPIVPQPVAGERRTGHLPVGFIIGVAACSLAALGALAAVAASGALPAGIGLTLALLPIPALLAGVLYLDRLEPEPPAGLLIVFLWGAAMAALIGLIGKGDGSQLLTTPELRSGGFAADSALAIIGVAALEETLKGVALVALFLLRPREVDGISDGVVYGGMVGLGFALIENIYYYAQATHYGFSGVATTFLLRGVVSPVCQTLFASLIGAGVAYAVTTSRRRGLWAIGAGWVVAVALHAVWNASLAASVSRLALTYAVLAVIVVILLVAVVMDRGRMIGLIVHYLPEYQATGIVTEADVSMLSSMPDRRQARQWARLHGGLAGLRDMTEYQLAATELGLLHRRSDRGLVDVASFTERRDVLLGGMQTATVSLLSQLNDQTRPPWAPHDPSCFRTRPLRPRPATAQRDETAPQPDVPSAEPGTS
ncbi:MAG TPA: PrsW family intramembrane metalloprotease [Streptosporangiaceae bacterium]|nr:PrsW family intramembrane metalloprotease [Streptosporangiaceae bacterium]